MDGRDFSFFCVITFALSVIEIDLTEIKESDINIYNFLPVLPSRTCETPNDYKCDPVIQLISSEFTNSFKLSNGIVKDLDNRYTQEQVQIAYENAKQDLINKRNKALSNAIKISFKYLIGSWITVYFIGLMIGWIWRGFKHNS